MMEEKPKSLLKHGDELTSRILKNPKQRRAIILDFYHEMAESEDAEAAHFALLLWTIENAMSPKNSNVPSWFQPAGFFTLILTMVFLMGIILLNMVGYTFPLTAKFPLLAVFALGSAASVSFLGGEAIASGKIPFFGNQNPLAISATGGIAN